MESLFAAVNAVLSFITPVSDFFWDFPKNFTWYQQIPILGNFSLAIIVLVGSGLYFTFRLGFIQVRILRRESGFWCTGAGPIQGFPLWRPSF